MRDDSHIIVPRSLLCGAMKSLDALGDIIGSEVDIPEGECTCITSKYPPCAYCESDACQWSVQMSDAEDVAHAITDLLDEDHARHGRAALEPEDMEGFGSF